MHCAYCVPDKILGVEGVRINNTWIKGNNPVWLGGKGTWEHKSGDFSIHSFSLPLN